MLKELLPTLAVIILIVGCAGREEPPKQEPVNLRNVSEVITYNTGDSDVWPTFDFPLEIKIEIPEVPEGIRGPFPESPEERD